MRIANATDLYGNPYLTSVTVGDVVNSAVTEVLPGAVESAIGDSINAIVDSAVSEAVPSAVEEALGSSIDAVVDTAVTNAIESGDFVRDSELSGKIESMGTAITTALDTEGYLNDCVKEDNLDNKLKELGYVPGGGTGTVPSETIEFTSADSEKVTWSGNVATFTHSLNCIPSVIIYDSTSEQVLAALTFLGNSSFSVDFGDKSQVTGTWTAVVTYAGEAAGQAEPEP